MPNLAGRTVLITGAASGIGAAAARRLAADGARLVLADLDGAKVEKVAGELGQVAVKADVTRSEDIEQMLEEVYRRWGRLDVLFNNAGVIRVQSMFDVTGEEWDRVMNVNLRAAFFVLQAAARGRGGQKARPGSDLPGKLVHPASIAAFRAGNPRMPPSPAPRPPWSASRARRPRPSPPSASPPTACARARWRRPCGNRSTASGALSRESGRARCGSGESGGSRSAAPSAPRTSPM